MQFQAPLVPGRLLLRYKRFLADVVLETGDTVTAHCANPGSMLGLVAPGNRVWLSRASNPLRKLRYSWELVEANVGAGPHLVGINTALPNRLVAEALRAGFFTEFAAYDHVRPEVKYGVASRVDFVLSADREALPPCYLEVKNVHMMRVPGLAEFPDCVTQRGTRHLHELSNVVAKGQRAAMLYLIQMRAERFDLARDIDPRYAQAFAAARAAGVEMIAVVCEVGLGGIRASHRVPIVA